MEKEEDVVKIRDGEVKAKTIRPRNKFTRTEAFLKYLAIFYDRPEVKVIREQ